MASNPEKNDKQAIQRSLTFVGLDVIRYIMFWLDGAETGRLYLCGDKVLQNWLTVRGAVRRIHLDYDYDTARLFWPNLVTHFASLTHFAYMRGRVKGNVVFNMTHAHLKLLPPTIEELWLGGDRAEHCWFIQSEVARTNRLPSNVTPEYVAKTREEYIDLAKYFPNLRRLLLRETSGSLRTFDDTTTLWFPDWLTWISLYWNTTMTSQCFQYLPKTMHTIRFGNNPNMLLSDCHMLPSSLTKLIIPRMTISSSADLMLLPRTLVSLVASFNEPPPNAPTAWPPGLRKLGRIPLHEEWASRLPPTITCLVTRDELKKWADIRKFPDSLRHITIGAAGSNTFFSNLPPNVERVKILSHSPSFTKEILQTAPISLRWIQLPYSVTHDFPANERIVLTRSNVLEL